MTRGGAVISLSGVAVVHSLTAGDGPFSLWLCQQSLSLTLFEEYLEQNGPLFPTETANAERVQRGKQVRYLGMVVPVGNGEVAALSLKNQAMSGLRWTEGGEGGGLQLCLYNTGKTLTTGSTFLWHGQHFVRWAPGG